MKKGKLGEDRLVSLKAKLFLSSVISLIKSCNVLLKLESECEVGNEYVKAKKLRFHCNLL